MRRRPDCCEVPGARARTRRRSLAERLDDARAHRRRRLRVNVTGEDFLGLIDAFQEAHEARGHTVVLPEPAGACSTIERRDRWASSRARASAALLSDSIIEGHLQLLILG